MRTAEVRAPGEDRSVLLEDEKSKAPAESATTPERAAEGTVVWPYALLPQAITLPFDLRARLWYAPAAIAVTPDSAAAGTSASPSPSLPQATTMPFDFRARL